jgi:AcrR family transcriptional regulator
MKAAKEARAARERILETATDLFANQGYRATGINEVIDKSGVAKATFYHHFPTKADLCLAYLKTRNSSELNSIKDFIAKKRTPWSRFLGVIARALAESKPDAWLQLSEYGGRGT